MRKYFLLGIVTLYNFVALAQEKEEVKLDLLKAPSSPAANLLGFANSDIDKPTDISSFMLSLQSATSGFSKLPSNYAIDLSPHYLFSKKGSDVTTTGLQSKKFSDIFHQTFVVSFAVRNPDSTDKDFNPKSTYAGLGFKFSICRGEYDDNTQKALGTISEHQTEILSIMQEAAKTYREKNDPAIKALKEKQMAMVSAAKDPNTGQVDPQKLLEIVQSREYKDIEESKSKLMLVQLSKEEQKAIEKLNKGSIEDLSGKIQKVAASFQTNRVGFTWDISAGISGEFLNKRFDSSKVYKAGIWSTFGHTDKKGSSFLGLIRYLYNPDQIFADNNAVNKLGNISTLDAGFKYSFSKLQSKFSCSIEAIYRSVLSSKTISPSWRFIFNADYAFWQNQKLTFSFGRNFDGTTTKDGNLLAALGFLTGFGNKR